MQSCSIVLCLCCCSKLEGKEIEALLDFIGVPKTYSKAAKFMKKWDDDNDGAITFDEFAVFMRPKKA